MVLEMANLPSMGVKVQKKHCTYRKLLVKFVPKTGNAEKRFFFSPPRTSPKFGRGGCIHFLEDGGLILLF